MTGLLARYGGNLQEFAREVRDVRYQGGECLQGKVKNVLIFTAPGQGAQTPGFLSPWLELPGLAERLGSWSELAARDLIRLGTTSSAEEITDTAVAQPLLVAAALAVAELLPEPDAVAGHSVGEFAAGAIAGVLSAEDAVKLTRIRGEAMAAACDALPTGMTAVLGGDEADVLAAIADAGLTPANVNTAGQIVAGGTLEQLAEFAAKPPAGTRLRPLRVAGAFHTRHMAEAVAVLEAAAADTAVKDPAITLLSNRDGAVVTAGTDWVERVAGQVARPVRWDRCMATMADLGVSAFIELLPGGTLTGMAKRALPGVELLAIKTPDELDAARSLIAAHSTAKHSAANHGAADHGAADHGAADHGAADHRAADHGAADHRAADHGAADHGAANHGAAEHSRLEPKEA
jgi:[acyl-carrier-protein] S-malonyltransferase